MQGEAGCVSSVPSASFSFFFFSDDSPATRVLFSDSSECFCFFHLSNKFSPLDDLVFVRSEPESERSLVLNKCGCSCVLSDTSGARSKC